MSYAITIRREGGPAITPDEWRAFVRGNPALVVPDDGTGDFCTWKDDERCEFLFDDGAISIDHATEGWEQIVGEVAAGLGAIAVGDDGERYLADGTVVGQTPILPGKHLPDWMGFALACAGVLVLFAWFAAAIWLFRHFRVGGWGVAAGVVCVVLSRLRWREALVREALLAFGGTTALAGAIAWVLSAIVTR